MTQLAGICNLTPDSFSGDGTAAKAQAIDHIDAMLESGVAIVDIGAESTRPGAVLLSPEEEWQRLSPVLESLGARVTQARFSIDTRHAATADKALALGFSIVNDVSGNSSAAMLGVLRTYKASLILMHSLGVPADPRHTLPEGSAPVETVCDWAKKSLIRLAEHDIPPSRIILDPGIGFGKTAQQSLALIKGIAQLKALNIPLLIGHSRKSFLSLFTPHSAKERDMETLVISFHLVRQGVDFLRVHNVKEHATMLRMQALL
jgi:dihydropteroate synthase